jgi:hypothetical protein
MENKSQTAPSTQIRKSKHIEVTPLSNTTVVD